MRAWPPIARPSSPPSSRWRTSSPPSASSPRKPACRAQAVAAAEQAVQIALNEYRAGTQAFTTVVTAQATALSDEESLLTTREQRLAAAVSLIVALGGGWDTTQLPSPAAAAAGPGQAPPVRANAG